jgi:type II secretory pathway component HofQ
MSASSSPCRLLIAGIVLMYALVPTLPRAFSAEAEKESLAGAEKIRKALNQTITMDFADISLKDAIANLRDKTKLNIILDEEVVGSDTMESPTKITNFRNVKLRSGLQTLLCQYKLAYVILDDVLLITRKEAALDRQMQQPVNVDLDNVPFAEALRRLARETASNLVLDPREESQAVLSMQLEEVPLQMAVRTMAEAVSLKPVLIGNVLFITSEARANQLQEDPDTKSPAALRKLLEDETYMLVPGEQGGAKIVPRTTPVLGLGAPGGMGMFQAQPGPARPLTK